MQHDPKQGEREYFARIGPEGIRHSTLKPFSDEYCSINLANMDALFHFLAPPPARLIEFGCGVGWLSLFLAQRGYQVTGVDISPDAIAAANRQREARGLANAEFRVGDYEDPVPAGAYDYALFYDSLHHAEVEQLAVQRACEALKPGGALIAFETSAGHAETAVSKHAVAEFGVHEKDMTVDYIAQLGARAGFSRHLIIQRPHQLIRSLYRPSYAKGASGLDLKFRLFLSKLRVIRRLFNPAEEKFIILWK
jgi:2-polyprenyl-3-methyl-5-hydroxy-6-metoxy-1,4-benzoquinol methylase